MLRTISVLVLPALLKARTRLVKILNEVYWKLPWRWRDPVVDICYNIAGPLFRGVGHYEIWKRRKIGFSWHLNVGVWLKYSHACLVNLKKFPLCDKAPGSIALHIHVYYHDLVPELVEYLQNIPFPYDIFVSVPNEHVRKICENAFGPLKHVERLQVKVVPNRGRDLAPFLVTFGQALQKYDFVAHIHTKKSLHSHGKSDGWREYLLGGLLGSEKKVRQIFSIFCGDQNVGMVYPQNYARLHYSANSWSSNKSLGQIWCKRLMLGEITSEYFHFPAGSMFWARTQALMPLFDSKIVLADFPEELGQTDGTLAHCLERLLGIVPIKTGYQLVLVRDDWHPSWSPWRFDQYLERTSKHAMASISSPEIKTVIFDVFDTLLIRPILDTKNIKSIVAHQAGDKIGLDYLSWRDIAEEQARQKAGKDVNLDAIYNEFSLLSKLSKQSIDFLHHLEESIEMELASPRVDVIALLEYALSVGKRVLLVCDSSLSKVTIENLLSKNGIVGWHDLYLSPTLGLQKDSGNLYRYILSCENVAPINALVVGDNEQLDFHIPASLGLSRLHILCPLNLARGLPRIGLLVDATINQGDLNDHLAMGLIVRRSFQFAFYPSFNPLSLVPEDSRTLGYTVVGPLLVAFIQWMLERAAQDGVKHFYFLSREGRTLKSVYDKWIYMVADAPTSSYLNISHRAVTVPMLCNLDDIRTLARKDFLASHIDVFLYHRYGLTLTKSQWDEIYKLNLWEKNKLISIQKFEINHIEPLLKFLATLILHQAEKERSDLRQYLQETVLLENKESAVVDINCPDSFQLTLNKLINKRVHGYYILAPQEIDKVDHNNGVTSQGAYFHTMPLKVEENLILQISFILEKLLTCGESQIVRHKNDKGICSKVYDGCGDLSEKDARSRITHVELQLGIEEYVSDVLHIRKTSHASFAPSILQTHNFLLAYLNGMTPNEKETLNALLRH